MLLTGLIWKVFLRPGIKKIQFEIQYKNYPPKYIISLANAVINGLELEPREFSGGKETNNYLTSLGFEIINKGIINS